MAYMRRVSNPALIGKERRLHSIFPSNGKCIIVPLDDSLISQSNEGLFQLQDKIRDIERAKPDAILCYQGTACLISDYDIPLILNLTASTINSMHTNKVLISSVEHAVMQDASAVALHINISSQYESAMLRNIGEVSEKCHYYGIPMMVLAYPRKENGNSDDNYADLRNNDIEKYTKLVSHCVRIAFELGADIIKTQYTGTPQSFEYVVKSAIDKPVIIAGGTMLNDEKLLEMVRGAISAGGAGVSIGRNIFNRSNSFAIIQKIREIVYGQSLPEVVC